MVRGKTRDPIWLTDIHQPKALLIIAHADDETIFASGLILSSRKTEWTIVCCNPQSRQREDEFLSACQFFAKESCNHIDPVLLSPVLDSDGHINKSWLTGELRSYALDYDFVLTHNKEGEYGNENHRRVYRCVVNTIANPNTWNFVSPGSTNVNQEVLKSKDPRGNFTLKLSSEVQRLKIRAFQECHKSQAGLYGYDSKGKLRDSDLKETLLWEFESGKEEYTFCM